MIKVTEDGKVCVVCDDCIGCRFDVEHCAIKDLLETCGLFASWEATKFPKYRERKREKKAGRENGYEV